MSERCSFASLCSALRDRISFESAASNYRALERAARLVGHRWLTCDAALGATSGSGTLLLDRTSWAHSLLRVDRPVGEPPVTIVTLEQALSELPPGGTRTIVKIDAEGSECDILMRPGAGSRIDLLMVEWHARTAPCTALQLAQAPPSSSTRRSVCTALSNSTSEATSSM